MHWDTYPLYAWDTGNNHDQAALGATNERHITTSLAEVTQIPETKSVSPIPTIPGWRVIRSDAGRYWASRVRPFTVEQLNRTDAYRTVDADTLDDLRAETARQEEAAEAVTP